MLFHIYLFVLFAGIGIGSVEYIRWCERSLPASADIPPEIALTFDDGPHPVYTKKLLDGLRKRGVKATFFLIGENIEGNEELVKQMAEDGHLIGNHTWSHVDVTKMSDKQACEEITKTSELVRSIVGYLITSKEKSSASKLPKWKIRASTSCNPSIVNGSAFANTRCVRLSWFSPYVFSK